MVNILAQTAQKLASPNPFGLITTRDKSKTIRCLLQKLDNIKGGGIRITGLRSFGSFFVLSTIIKQEGKK